MTIYENRTEDPGCKPVAMKATFHEKTGRFSLSRETYGPRGGVFMAERISFTREEMETILPLIRAHLDS